MSLSIESDISTCTQPSPSLSTTRRLSTPMRAKGAKHPRTQEDAGTADGEEEGSGGCP
jgi:hypothetical protein